MYEYDSIRCVSEWLQILTVKIVSGLEPAFPMTPPKTHIFIFLRVVKISAIIF